MFAKLHRVPQLNLKEKCWIRPEKPNVAALALVLPPVPRPFKAV